MSLCRCWRLTDRSNKKKRTVLNVLRVSFVKKTKTMIYFEINFKIVCEPVPMITLEFGH